MLKQDPAIKKMDTVFIIALFVLFAITAFSVVLIGAKQYELTSDSMNQNYETRTTASYLSEKLHQNDTSAGISVVDLDGTKAIAMNSFVDGKLYITYLYFYDGYLRELFVGADAVYSLSSGQKILELSNFDVAMEKENLIKVSYTDTFNQSEDIFLVIKSKKEELS